MALLTRTGNGNASAGCPGAVCTRDREYNRRAASVFRVIVPFTKHNIPPGVNQTTTYTLACNNACSSLQFHQPPPPSPPPSARSESRLFRPAGRRHHPQILISVFMRQFSNVSQYYDYVLSGWAPSLLPFHFILLLLTGFN